jgi:hypothetical protein
MKTEFDGKKYNHGKNLIFQSHIKLSGEILPRTWWEGSQIGVPEVVQDFSPAHPADLKVCTTSNA